MSETYNVDLLMQVREKIVNEPEAHRQQFWAMAQSDPRQGGACGTAYCVAGWACVLDGEELSWEGDEVDGWVAHYLADDETAISWHAKETLGLSSHEADGLFYGGNSRQAVLDMLDKLIEAGKNGERVPEGEL